jgi:hypothetical protein
LTSDLFKYIDDKDIDKFVSFLAPDCVFRFGNGPAVSGVSDIRQYVGGFFDSIQALSHQITDSWDVAGGKVCHGLVSYTRKDGTVLTVPFANVFEIDSTGIKKYLIFADTSELYL